MKKTIQKNETLATLLASWIAARGVTPSEAAPSVGVSHQTIYNWLSGDLPPSTRIPGIAAALGISGDRLRRIIDRERMGRIHTSTVTQGPSHE